MGVGLEAKALYAELLRVGDQTLRPGISVCELGSQDMWPESDRPARDYYLQDLGVGSYVCIDMDGRHDALRMNLNEATAEDVTTLMRGRGYKGLCPIRFDLVTNHGTSEHCFNQANVMKLVHDLTKVQGTMIHLVPSHPWQHHDDSFFYYAKQLFADMAHVNGYGVLKCEYIDSTCGNMVQAVLRRTNDNEFVVPFQGCYHVPPALGGSGENIVLAPSG